MFGKYFFIFVFKNLFLRIKSKGNLFIYFFFLCFQNQKHNWLLERIKQFSHYKKKKEKKIVKYGCIFSLIMTSLVGV